ncbi:NUDIX domain-containing protein [bacterium]|nr:NUDIX domain-containing protein [bacterium]
MSALPVRVVAVVHRRDRLLLNRTVTPAGTVYTLFGGHLEAGETAAQCLEREFLEELGWPLKVGPLLWVVENRWVEGDSAMPNAGESCHEVGIYLYAEVMESKGEEPPKALEGHLWPGWFSEGEVKGDGHILPATLEEALFEGLKTGFIDSPSLLTDGF